MPKIDDEHYLRMKSRYRHDVASHLASLAGQGLTITYGQLAKKFGGTARGWGDDLGGIAIRCNDNHYPLLPVLVVNARSSLPSVDAVLYQDLGLLTESDVRAEMLRCFAFNWMTAPMRVLGETEQ